MKILLTGRDGQVGFALHKKLISLGKVIATNRETLNLTNFNEIKAFVDRVEPDIIINAAAYTKVDQAESESALAYQINVEAPKALEGLEAPKELSEEVPEKGLEALEETGAPETPTPEAPAPEAPVPAPAAAAAAEGETYNNNDFENINNNDFESINQTDEED